MVKKAGTEGLLLLNSFLLISENTFISVLFLKHRFTGYKLQVDGCLVWGPGSTAALRPVRRSAETPWSRPGYPPAPFKGFSLAKVLLRVSRVPFFLVIPLVNLWSLCSCKCISSQRILRYLFKYCPASVSLILSSGTLFGLLSSKTVNLSVIISYSSFFVLFWVISLD